jgi:integrase
VPGKYPVVARQVGYVRQVPIFRGERAVLPADGSVVWVVVNGDYELQVEATAFLAGLRGRDLSPNTERVYAGRVALYLTYCSVNGLDWTDPGFLALKRFQDWLVSEPLPARGPKGFTERRFRSQGSANAVLTAVCEFLRFGASHGWVPVEAVAVLSEPKYLRHLPPGYDAGEFGQFRTVTASTLRFRVAEPGYETLTTQQIDVMIGLARTARDRFLIALLAVTGMRIGEALGMRREDVHLLPDSRSLGCAIEGPHVHVRRRRDNINGALAKARVPRSIPVTAELAGFYGDYQLERDGVGQAAASDMVFVNLLRKPLGAAMTYGNAKGMFDRLAARAGFTVRPHLLRHSAATRWIGSGVGRDVVQNLLGHVSPASLAPYLHPNEDDKRDAVERAAAFRLESR